MDLDFHVVKRRLVLSLTALRFLLSGITPLQSLTNTSPKLQSNKPSQPGHPSVAGALSTGDG